MIERRAFIILLIRRTSSRESTLLFNDNEFRARIRVRREFGAPDIFSNTQYTLYTVWVWGAAAGGGGGGAVVCLKDEDGGFRRIHHHGGRGSDREKEGRFNFTQVSWLSLSPSLAARRTPVE